MPTHYVYGMLEPMPRLRSAKATVIEGGLVHHTTGEVFDLTGARLEMMPDKKPGRPNAKKQRRHPMFALIDTPRMAMLELTIQEQRVFWCILGHLSKDTGKSRVGTSEIAVQTAMHYSNVGATLGSLKKRHIIFREHVGVWIVNPWIAYAGSVDDWEADTTDFPQPEWSRS